MIRLFVKGGPAHPGVAMPVGSTTTWADGSVHKKISQYKWTIVRPGNGKSTRTDLDKKAENYYDESIKQAWAGLGIVEHLEDKFGVTDYAGLKKLIRTGPKDQASKVFRSTKDYVDSLSIPTGNKAAAVDKLGRSLLVLRDTYAGPKKKLTVKVQSKVSGKARYEYQPSQVSFSATRIKAAQKKLGGWSDMSKTPTMTQLRAMEKNGTAKIIWGKPKAKKKWEVYQKVTDTIIPFKERAKGIDVKMRQFEVKDKRTLRTVTVELTIPYPFARQFIEHNIKSERTKSNLVGQLTRSAGYKKAAM